ncbi:MAG: AbrB/MazE/SpoVT family DNA-binding domain-containing protein, partial [Desulfobacterales bacterium]
MVDISTTKMSSKGQVVIPEAIRKKLGLKPGDQFVVTGDKDVVILKSISPPSLDEFEDLIA